jgi:hypothetical protein
MHLFQRLSSPSNIAAVPIALFMAEPSPLLATINRNNSQTSRWGILRCHSNHLRQRWTMIGDNRGARELLLRWARAHAYWDRAAKYCELARSASDADVRQRFVVISQHYRTLAKAEERSAEQAGARRLSTERLH